MSVKAPENGTSNNVSVGRQSRKSNENVFLLDLKICTVSELQSCFYLF